MVNTRGRHQPPTRGKARGKHKIPFKKLPEGQKTFNELTGNQRLSKKKVRAHWDLPASSEVRTKASQIMALRILGHSTAEIAEEVHLKPKTVLQYLYLAGKNGWLRFDDPADRLQFELAPTIVDNIAHHLKAKDKVMTIEAAKGIGLFKAHQSIKSETEAPNMLLALKIEMPAPEDGASETKIAIPAGAIMSVPRKEE